MREWLRAAVLVMLAWGWSGGGVAETLPQPDTSLSRLQPLNLLTDEQKEGGYLIPIAREAFRRAGYKADVQLMPWKRALSTVVVGGGDGLLGVYYTDERAQHLHYSEPIGKTELVFFQRRGAGIRFESLKDLAAYRIGVVNGGVYTPEFDQADYLDKHPITNVEMQIEMLFKGRLDLIVDQKEVVYKFLHANHPDQLQAIEPLNPPLAVTNYYVAFSRQDPKAQPKLAAFNRALQQMRDDGTYEAIYSRHPHP